MDAPLYCAPWKRHVFLEEQQELKWGVSLDVYIGTTHMYIEQVCSATSD